MAFRLVTGEHVIGWLVSADGDVYRLRNPQFFQTGLQTNPKTNEKAKAVGFLDAVPFGNGADELSFPGASRLYCYERIDEVVARAYMKLGEPAETVLPATDKDLKNMAAKLGMVKGGKK